MDEKIGPATYSVRDLRRLDRDKIANDCARGPRYLEVEPACWMCDAPAGVPTSKEHIFGQWMGKHFDGPTQEFKPIRQYLGLTGEVRGPMPRSAMTVGRVCAPCNNGWMSRLEVDAESLIFNSDRVLSTVQSHALALWLAKTSAIINVSQGYRLLWPREVRHQLRASLPASVRVCVFRSKDRDLNWAQGLAFAALTPSHWPLEVLTKVIGLTHSCVIRVDDLVALVVNMPAEVSYARLRTSGSVLWDGRDSHPVDLTAAPLLKDWLGVDFDLDMSSGSAFQSVPHIEGYAP